MQEVERTAGLPFSVPKLLESVYAGKQQTAEGKGGGDAGPDSHPSDFRSHQGIIYLTLEESGNPSMRVYGNLFGSPEIRRYLEVASPEGQNLGEILQRPGEAPLPYVILDKLFTPKLGRVQKGQNTTGAEWKALVLADNSPKADGVYLIPFHSSILRYFTLEELRECIVAENNIGAIQVTLTHKIPGRELKVRKSYGIPESMDRSKDEQIEDLDPSLDLRLFPKFRLDSVANVATQLPSKEDRHYHARARLSPNLEKTTFHWLGDKGVLLKEQPRIEGDYVKRNKETNAEGRRAFWRFPMENPPLAFEVEGYGLILLSLQDLGHKNQKTTSWTAAIDFGTTNSCVAIDRGGGADTISEAEKLPVIVTTFLQKWRTDLRGDSDEGCSALADFFFWQNPATQYLNEREFFPTQIMTTHPLAIGKLPDENFNPDNGLAFFPNVSLAAVENRGFTDLIKGFEGLDDSAVEARFNLNRSLKWRDEDGQLGNSQIWREVFHQHLRYQLIITAAREKSAITRLVASYPKAFLPSEVTDYRNVLRKIWGEYVAVELRSESLAAAMTLEITQHHEYFLVDMGGGTTDIAVFKDEEVEEECSFKLAGGLLEEYVGKSPALREVITHAFDVKGSVKKAFVESNKQAEFYRTFFQGFLAQKGTAALVDLQKFGKDDRATQGFFFTSLVLYSGLSYFCGLWLKRRREGIEGITSAEHLQWLGNGSSFIKMLTVGDKAFEDVLIRIFNKACDGKAGALPPLSNAKTVVAKGLLKHGLAAKVTSTETEVFSSLLSNSIVLNGVPWSEEESLSKFYKAFDGSHELRWNGLQEGAVFHGFLKALQEALPGGQHNRGTLVNPATLGGANPTSWVMDFINDKDNRVGIEKQFSTRLRENKRRWGGTMQSEETLYVEPIFISELTAMLVQIREVCAARA